MVYDKRSLSWIFGCCFLVLWCRQLVKRSFTLVAADGARWPGKVITIFIVWIDALRKGAPLVPHRGSTPCLGCWQTTHTVTLPLSSILCVPRLFCTPSFMPATWIIMTKITKWWFLLLLPSRCDDLSPCTNVYCSKTKGADLSLLESAALLC